ncbi:hypothetical protein LCFBJUUZ_CDS0136 [Staphylococcus phage PG-2021_76]|uniref:Uncharacterized protein n=1 Tax=Mammaliicoccus phage MSShimriz1 TaxID=3230127 RepID=A0AAU8GUF5_9VIRU
MEKEKIKAIIVTTTCPNFRDGGMLIIEEGLTDLPLEQALTRIEDGIETNTSIRIPHKEYKGYMRLFPQFIVSYDVHTE